MNDELNIMKEWNIIHEKLKIYYNRATWREH
jgi:hypothetical protein